MTKNISYFFDYNSDSIKHIINIKRYNSNKRDYNDMNNHILCELPPFPPILVKHPYGQNEYQKSNRKIFLFCVINKKTLDKIKLYNEHMIKLNNNK